MERNRAPPEMVATARPMPYTPARMGRHAESWLPAAWAPPAWEVRPMADGDGRMGGFAPGLLERQWDSFRAHCLPGDMPAEGQAVLCRTFFAGAGALLYVMAETEEDPRAAAALHAELTSFVERGLSQEEPLSSRERSPVGRA